MRFVRWSAGVGFFFHVWTAAHAQVSTFELRGTVLDELGGTLAGATLSLVHEESGLTRTATTGDSGRYIFVGMPTGTYGVS